MSTSGGSDLVLTVLVDREGPDLDGLTGIEVRTVGARDLPRALRGADALLVWDFSGAGVAEAWPEADRLRWMHVSSAGVDRVLTPAVVRSGVVVTNARGVLDAALAEYVLGLVLALVKDLPGTLLRQSARRWEHRPTGRLAGRRALIVGLGGIGRSIARLLRAVGVEVDGVARTGRPGDGVVGTVHPAGILTEVVGRYDVVVLAAPLTEATRGLVDRRVLAAMGPSTLLINVGRGGLIDEAALVEVLGEERIGGAALDVFSTEPLPADHSLWTTPRTIISPHMSGDYHGWRDDLLALFLDNLDRFRRGAPLQNVVDNSLGYVSEATDPHTALPQKEVPWTGSTPSSR